MLPYLMHMLMIMLGEREYGEEFDADTAYANGVLLPLLAGGFILSVGR